MTEALASAETERALLGAILLDPSIRVDLAATEFSVPENRLVYGAILELQDDRERVDVQTIAARLSAQNNLQKAGDLEYLAVLNAYFPDPLQAPAYASIIADRARRREARELGAQIALWAASGVPTDQLLDRIQTGYRSLSDRAAPKGGPEDLSSVLRRVVSDLSSGRRARAIPTGLPQLDRILAGGIRPGTVTVVGARTNQGKTAFAQMLMVSAALGGEPALLVSLEMTKEEIAQRLLANESSTHLSVIRERRLSPLDQPNLAAARDRLLDTRVSILSGIYPDFRRIEAAIRKEHRDKGITVLVVDYLQLCESSSKGSRELEVATVSRALKRLALELDLAVVALSQLNRKGEGPEQETPRPPRLGDLRESGAIEQDADVVILLHRPKAYDDRLTEDICYIHVAKQRNGALGKVKALYEGAYTRFVPLKEGSVR